IEVSGTIKNKNDLAVRDVVVLVRFVDENGDKLATKTATIDEIPAGETADFSVGYWELERHYGAIKDYTLKVTWENKIPENQP
ncbi:MAG: FxLYD domain-containing protein, partial [Thermoplasmatota archaeon]